MSKAALLVNAAQFAPRFLHIRRSTWLAIALGLMGLVALFFFIAYAVFGWLWGQGRSLTERAPEAVSLIASQLDEVVPSARQKLADLAPALKPEPLPRDVSGTDIGPVARYPGLVRSHWHRDGGEITVRYEGRADYIAVLDHYVQGFAMQGFLQSVMSATPEAETHDYTKNDERVRFEITRLPQGKVKAMIVAVLQ